MIQARSIATQILLPALVCMTVLTVLLSGVFVWTGVQRLTQEFDARGNAIARQIAPALSYPLSAGFESDLRRLLSATAKESDVIAAAVYNADKSIAVRVNRDAMTVDPVDHKSDVLAYRAEILDPGLIVDDFDYEGEPGNPQPVNATRGFVEVFMDPQGLQRAYQGLYVKSALIALAILLLSAFLLTRLSRNVIESIRDTTGTVQQLRRGDLSARASLSEIDELRSLQSGINDMAHSLSESQESMRSRISQATGRLVNTVNELERSEARYRDLFEHATDGVFMLNRKLEIVDSNLSMEKLAADVPGNITGRSLIEFLAPSQWHRVRNFYSRQRDSASSRNFEVRFICKNRLVEISSSPIVSDGRVTGYHGVARDMTQRDRVQRAMLSARDEAEKANMAKTTFLASVSHEIRTPMNGILGFLSLLKKTPLDVVQAEYIDTAQQSASSLLRIIDDLLDTAASETGQLEFDPQPFKLAPFLNHLVRAHLPVAESAGIQLLDDVCPNLPKSVVTDPDRLRQILSNLLTNAIKFTDQGQVVLRVTCEVNETSALLIFEVEDTGIGIVQADQERIMRAFERANEATNRQYDGMGLGLNIADRLAHLLGGRIDIASTPGSGTTVSFRASFFIADGDEQPKTVAPSILHQPAPEVVTTKDKAEPHLLVVDDSRINTAFVAALLKLYGANVTTCTSGHEAIKLCEGTTFDLILMDVHMPDMDGFEATARLRNMHGVDCPPVVALTADASATTRARVEAECDDILLKPVNEQMLVDVIHKISRHKLVIAQPPQANPSIDLENELVDSTRGIELAGGDVTVWQSNIQLLAEDISTRLRDLAQANDPTMTELLGQHAHRIAGSAAYIGARQLERHARALETAARVGRDIEPARHDLIDSANQFIEFAEGYRRTAAVHTTSA